MAKLTKTAKRITPLMVVELVLLIACLTLFGVNVYLRVTGHPGFASTRDFPAR